MRYYRLQYHLLLVSAILGLLLAACSTSTPAPEPTAEPVVITFACLGYEASAYEELAARFHEANPGITVQVVPIEEIVGGDYEISLHQLASGADTLTWWIEPYMTRRGLFKDLTPFIEADRNFQPDDFYPGTLESLQWDGGTWGLPAGIELGLIFYDKVAFDAAGVPYPEPGWAWDDFLEKAILLTEREGDTVTRWGFVELRPDPFPFIVGRVGSLVDYSTTPPTPLLNQPAVAEAVRWYADLQLKYQVMPYLESSPCESERPCESEGEFLITNGQATMWSGLSADFERYNQGRQVGVVPYPIEEQSDATSPVSVWPVYVMSVGTSHPEESWRWLDYLSRRPGRQPGIDLRGVLSLSLPPRRSVAEEIGYWESLDREIAAAYKFALAHGLARSDGDDVLNALNDALNVILKDEQNIETALAHAQAEAFQDLYGQALGNAPPQKLVVATPKIETGEATVIIFALSFAPFHTDAAPYREVARTFHDTHPDITVEVKEPYFTTGFGLEEMASSGDCFLWYNEVPDEESLQSILSLNPFLEVEPDFPLNDFYSQTLDAFRWQGGLWALPAEVQMRVIYYNKDLFDAAGVAYPQPGWDLDKFLNAARALTRGEGDEKQYGFLPLYDDASELITFIFLQGASPMDAQTDPPKPYFDDPDVVRAVRWYAELVTIHGVKPIFPGEEPSRLETTAWDLRKSLVNMGRVALWSNFIGTVISSPSDVRAGVVSLPSGDGTISGWFVEGYYISADTPYPQQCWEWIKFLSEHSLEVVKGPPARRSVAEAPDFRAKVGEEAAEAFLFSMAHIDQAHPWYAIYAPHRSYYWLVEAYGQILRGEEPGRALAEAQSKAEAYIACLEIKGDPADEAVQKACAREADPNYRELYE